jgi:AcrR family transcriptional regulator
MVTDDVTPLPARRRLPAAERRAQIERRAAELFARGGYAHTTMDAIAAAAGVTKPMLYRHFESKRELFAALIEQRRDELAAAPLDRYLDPRTDPSERVHAMTDAWFAHVERHPHTSRMLFTDVTGDAELVALQSELRRRQRAADVALMREMAPHLPAQELEPLGEVIRSALIGLALWWLERPGVPREVPVAAFVRVTAALVRPPTA